MRKVIACLKEGSAMLDLYFAGRREPAHQRLMNALSEHK
jgi:hypothetical protein